MTRSKDFRRNEGAALLTALGLLIVFTMLGIAWVRFMAIEHEQSAMDTHYTEAIYAARGGINAGIETAREAVVQGAMPSLAEPITYELAVYRDNVGKGADLEASDSRVIRVRVHLEDESARININYAPPNVLREILGVDGETARQIRSDLPRSEGGAGDNSGNRRWFTDVDELVTRGLLKSAQLTPEMKQMLTVYTVPNPADAKGYMNVNTAPVPVLEALLAVTPDVAKRVIDARSTRPFSDVTELSAAAGKDPATFNVRPAPDALNTLPDELSFTSRCFRVIGDAELVDTRAPAEGRAVLAAEEIEAVVYIDRAGNPDVLYWNESVERNESDDAQESTSENPAA